MTLLQGNLSSHCVYVLCILINLIIDLFIIIALFSSHRPLKMEYVLFVSNEWYNFFNNFDTLIPLSTVSLNPFFPEMIVGSFYSPQIQQEYLGLVLYIPLEYILYSSPNRLANWFGLE